MIVNKVYKGTTPFVKGYKGTTVIFEEGRRLPSEYQQVEYIKSTSDSQRANYIDTGIYPNERTVLTLTYKVDHEEAGGYQRLFGCDVDMFVIQEASASYWHVRYNFSLDSYRPVLDTIHTLSLGNNQYIEDGEVKYDYGSQTFQCNNQLRLFASYLDKDGRMYLYSCQIHQDGELVRDFVPCYIKATNEVGLYDFVTGQFFHNLGNVPFVAGGNV